MTILSKEQLQDLAAAPVVWTKAEFDGWIGTKGHLIGEVSWSEATIEWRLYVSDNHSGRIEADGVVGPARVEGLERFAKAKVAEGLEAVAAALASAH